MKSCGVAIPIVANEKEAGDDIAETLPTRSAEEPLCQQAHPCRRHQAEESTKIESLQICVAVKQVPRKEKTIEDKKRVTPYGPGWWRT